MITEHDIQDAQEQLDVLERLRNDFQGGPVGDLSKYGVDDQIAESIRMANDAQDEADKAIDKADKAYDRAMADLEKEITEAREILDLRLRDKRLDDLIMGEGR